MKDLEYCPECSTYIGPGPASRTDCPACGADLREMSSFDEDDESSPDVDDDEDLDDPDSDESGETW